MAQKQERSKNQSTETKQFAEPSTTVERAFATPGFSHFLGEYPDASEFTVEEELTGIQEKEVERRFEVFQAIQTHVPELKVRVKETMAKLFPGAAVDSTVLNSVEKYYRTEAIKGNEQVVLEMAQNMERLKNLPNAIEAKSREIQSLIDQFGKVPDLQKRQRSALDKQGKHEQQLQSLEDQKTFKEKFGANEKLAERTQGELLKKEQALERSKNFEMLLSYQSHIENLSNNLQTLEQSAKLLGTDTAFPQEMQNKYTALHEQLRNYGLSEVTFEQKLVDAKTSVQEMLNQILSLSREQSDKAQNLIDIANNQVPPNPDKADILANLRSLPITYRPDNHPQIARYDFALRSIQLAQEKNKKLQSEPLDEQLAAEFLRDLEELERSTGIQIPRSVLSAAREMNKNIAETPEPHPEKFDGLISRTVKKLKAGWQADSAKKTVLDISNKISRISDAKQAKEATEHAFHKAGAAIFDETDLIKQVVEAAKKQAEEKKASEFKGNLSQTIRAFSSAAEMMRAAAEHPYIQTKEEFTVEIETATGIEKLTLPELINRRAEVLLKKYEQQIIEKITPLKLETVSSHSILGEVEKLRKSFGDPSMKREMLELEIQALTKALSNSSIPDGKKLALRGARSLLQRGFTTSQSPSKNTSLQYAST